MVWPTIMWRGKRRMDRCQSEPYTLPAFCQFFCLIQDTTFSSVHRQAEHQKSGNVSTESWWLPRDESRSRFLSAEMGCAASLTLLSRPPSHPKKMHLQPHLDHLHNTFFFSKADPASIITEPCPFCPAVRVKRRQASSGIIARSTEPRWTNQQP